MNYVAQQHEVTAQAIRSIEPLECKGVLDVGAQFGLLLILEDGTKFPVGKNMIVRHVPSAGDFLVSAQDGFTSLLPKEIFAQRYRAVAAEVLGDEDAKFNQ